MATALSFGATYAILLLVFTPRLILSRTLATGGDMGSHHYVSKAAAAFLPWSLGGWASGWYAGMPMLEFYFPAPYALIWLVSNVTGYEIAFKLVTVLGIFLLPAAAWILFKLMDAPRLACAIAPAAAAAFLWIEGREGPPDTTQLDIFGGFITSTMAGEFGYSIAIALALVCLGLLYRATRRSDARLPWGLIAGTALLVGVTTVTHLIPITLLGFAAPALVVGRLRLDRAGWVGAAFAGGVVFIAGFVLLLRTDVMAGPWYAVAAWLGVLVGVVTLTMAWVAGLAWRRLVTVVTVAALGFGVAAFWFVPFWVLHEFTAPSKWDNVAGAHWVAPLRFWPILAVALAGIGVAIWRRRPGPLVLAWTGMAAAAAFELIPNGPMVNGRLLPVWYLMMCLVAVWTIGEILEAIPLQGDWRPAWAAIALVAAAALAATSIATSQKNSPGGRTWATHNYSGYQAQAGWPELQELMRTIQALPPGRVAWEYNADYSRFGTPRALENIPFFTDKDTMEGLLVEGSTSALPHFWLQGLFSPAATGAVPGYAYPSFDAEDATALLELFGIRWFAAETASVVSGFGVEPGVTEYGMSGDRFTIFEIEDASMVSIPRYEPVQLDPQVLEAMPDWRTDVVLPWLQNPAGWDVPLTLGAFGAGASGDNAALAAHDLERIESVEELATAPRRPTPDPGPVAAETERTRLSFRTERVGEPHIVAMSYFPNWQADGADGPYFLAPSLMLVYPTQEDVTLTYRPNPVERLGGLVSLVSLGIIAGLGAGSMRRLIRERRASGRHAAPRAGRRGGDGVEPGPPVEAYPV